MDSDGWGRLAVTPTPWLLSFSVRGRREGDESVSRLEGKQSEERKNKLFGPSGRPVW